MNSFGSHDEEVSRKSRRFGQSETHSRPDVLAPPRWTRTDVGDAGGRARSRRAACPRSSAPCVTGTRSKSIRRARLLDLGPWTRYKNRSTACPVAFPKHTSIMNRTHTHTRILAEIPLRDVHQRKSRLFLAWGRPRCATGTTPCRRPRWPPSARPTRSTRSSTTARSPGWPATRSR